MPSSKLGAYCSKVIEAGWLAAVIATPLFFNVYSSRVFEPDKLTLLRSIASVMVVAWLIQWIEQRNAPRSPTAASWRSALVLPTLILAGVYLLTTLTSITPRVSFFGSYQRLQGTYTTLSYMIVFLMMVHGLRTRQQLDRLILTIILTSLPIALYGLIQKYKLDPLPWGGDVTSRVASNMGNPIFVAAFLIMAFFLTLGKIVESFRAILTEEEAYVADIVRAAGYVFVAAVQAITIVFSGSRGPWLGWFAGLFLFALLLALLLRQRALMLTFIVLAVAGIVFLLVLNLPNTPLEKLREMPYFGTLGRIFESEGGTGKVRTLIWEGNTQLVPPHEPIQFPDDSVDQLNLIRPLVGYGPESMYVAYNRFYPPDLAHYESRNASPDRSHNETWDSLVITGLIGLLAYQFLFISFFIYGLRWVGLMPTHRERNIFIGLWVGLGLIGGLATIVLRDPKYLGVGIPVGIMAGIIIYLIVFAIALYDRPQEIAVRRTDQIILVALLAGVLAHYIEIHFGIAIASTRTMFWAFAGMLVVIGSNWLHVEEAKPAQTAPQPQRVAPAPTNVPRHKKRRPITRPPERPTTTAQALPPWVGSVAGHALITALILSTLFYEFVTNADRLADPLNILWRALTYVSLQKKASFAVLGIFALVWMLATLLATAEMIRSGMFKKSGDWPAGLALFASLSMGAALVFGLGLASQLGLLVRFQAMRIEDLVTVSDRVASIYNYYYVGVFLLILLAGLALMVESRRQATAWSAAGGWGLVALLPAVLGVYLWINYSNMDSIRADIIYKQADPWDKQGQWDVSIAHYKHAIELAPQEDFYYLWLGRAYLEKGGAANVSPTSLLNENTQLEGILNLNVQQTAGLGRMDLLYAARAVLLRAREINPLNTDHSANLARLHRRWADLATDPAQKAKLADQASQYYVEATSLSPHNAILWNEWANLDMLKNDVDAALSKLNESLRLDTKFEQTYVYLGAAYMNKKDLDKAAEAYQKATVLRPGLLDAYSALAYIYSQQNKITDAIQASNSLVRLAPNDPNVWRTHQNMAVLYAQTGDFPAAINEAQIAASTAPTDARLQLNAYIAQLRAQMAQLASPAPPMTTTSP